MTSAARQRSRPPASRRGGAYLAVLGTAMIVVTVGVAALHAVGVRRQTVQRRDDAARAQWAAQSMLEIGLASVGMDRGWDVSHPSGVWQTLPAIDGATGKLQLVYDNADLASSRWVGVTVRVQASAGESRRVVSSEIALAAPGVVLGQNLIPDPSFESSLAGWSSFGPSFSQTTADSTDGSSSLFVSNRDGGDGVHYTLTGSISNGTTYDLSAMIRLSSSSDTAELAIVVMTTLGSTKFPISAAVGDTWIHMSGQVTPTWTGTLTGVYLQVITRKSNQEFLVDEVVVAPAITSPDQALTVDATTWRRELTP